MLNAELLERSAGDCSPFAFAQKQTSRLLHALQPASDVLFNGQSRPREHADKANATSSSADSSHENNNSPLAHKSGVNALAVEKFEGRYLISGAANGNVSLWDLELAGHSFGDGRGNVVHRPTGSVVQSSKEHSYGITGLSFYPFDSLAFISSSYDHTVKVYDSTKLQLSATFDLEAVVYSHAISPIANHLLIACATQHAAVRLADLRSGATTHSLVGPGVGAVLSVAWSPKDDHILASGGSDGSIHVWDIRRSVGSIGVLDMEDSIGVASRTRPGSRDHGKAHIGPANGMTWTEDGLHLVSTGHDERIRVWDISVGSNTLVNFGPVIRNADLATLSPLTAPRILSPPQRDVLFFPNGREILMCELFEGRLLKRLKAQSVTEASLFADNSGQRNLRNRVVDLAWRTHHIELLSAHADGTIRSWQPRTNVDAVVEEVEEIEDEDDMESQSRKRKRQTLDDIYREVTAPRVKFV